MCSCVVARVRGSARSSVVMALLVFEMICSRMLIMSSIVSCMVRASFAFFQSITCKKNVGAEFLNCRVAFQWKYCFDLPRKFLDEAFCKFRGGRVRFLFKGYHKGKV